MDTDDTRNLGGSMSVGEYCKKGIKRARAQVLVLLIVSVGGILRLFDVIPSAQELLQIGIAFVETYGVAFVAPVSFFENIVGVNVYFPGSIAILLTMASTAGDRVLAWLTFGAIVLPALASQILNFYVGRRFLGGRRGAEAARRNYESGKANLAFWLLFWHPHTAALTCLDAGAQGVRFGRFIRLILPPFFVWNGFWGLTMYVAGEAVIGGAADNLPAVLILIVLWFAWDFFDIRRIFTSFFDSESDHTEPV